MRMLVGAWQSEQFFIALAGTYQQADSRRLCLLSWWGGRRDESDGVVTRKAPWRPGGCPHLARAAHLTTGPPRNGKRVVFSVAFGKCVARVRLVV